MSRHAKNKARQAKISLEEIERIRSRGHPIASDEKSNPRILGYMDNGLAIVLVMALDDPEYLITLIEWRQR